MARFSTTRIPVAQEFPEDQRTWQDDLADRNHDSEDHDSQAMFSDGKALTPVTPELNKTVILVRDHGGSGLFDDYALGLQGSAFATGVKRLFDVASAGLLLAGTLPLMVLISIAIRWESKGPALFRHTRIGRGGIPFTLWKFRSMAADSEARLESYLREHPELREEWEATHKLKGDPRVTLVGRVLRRTSLDELPQLWNVLRGDMSLIGPRPIVEDEIPKYGNGFIVYRSVRPGLTGLWQVSGRSDTSYPRRVQLDTCYVREWSILLDLKIIWKTVGVILRANGAY